MRLVRKMNQSRRDFTGEYECEGCGHKETGNGYDDRHFHDNVIPVMVCANCGESTKTLGAEVQHTPTRYADWEVV